MTLRRTGSFRRFAILFLLPLLVLLHPAGARADSQDIAAVSRSVVRVALAATDGQSAYFVGHGSGVVVAPGRVLTNAHVVELVRSEPNIIIGIIPSQGSRSYGGRILAYSPGNDLALIAFDGANLPIATFFSGAPTDGEQVTAIGYPGAVDRAQGMSIQDIIKPMSPVRTSGTVSAGRASKQFDTVLHTAPMATGNSGGPLVDSCGRVIGINSFGSLSDGNDAEYGFAVSNREIAGFLRQAGVQVQRSGEVCRSMAEIEAAQRLADERTRADAAQRAETQAIAERERAFAARVQAQQTIIARRENVMALAALLLVAGGLAGGTALLSHARGDERQTRIRGAIGGVLILAALIAFLLRPGFDSAVAAPPSNSAQPDGGNAAAAAEPPPGVGDNLCRLEGELSRVTSSDTTDVPFNWAADGCLNGQTQFAQSDGRWSRVFVPNEEASISVRSFDPATGRYRADKFFVDEQTAERARDLRRKLAWSGCTKDPALIAQLTRMQGDIQGMLSAQPNERLVYRCERRDRKTASAAP